MGFSLGTLSMLSNEKSLKTFNFAVMMQWSENNIHVLHQCGKGRAGYNVVNNTTPSRGMAISS